MRLRSIFIIFAMLTGTISGSIQDNFKPALNKSNQNKMPGIDFIYMINLDKRPEKFNQSRAQLAPYGIVPYRFSAVNGWELSSKALNSLGINFKPSMQKGIMGTCYLPENKGENNHELVEKVGRNYYSHCLSRGAIGIVLSHLSILQDALDSGYDTIWVMEDDVEVFKDPNILTALIKKLDTLVGKKNWDVLFTDPDTKRANGEYIPCTGYAKRPNFEPKNPERFVMRDNISRDFRKVGARYGAYSMIVRKSGMKKILKFITHNGIFLPYDLEFYLPNDINLYTTRYDIVSTLTNALSDNGKARYEP